MLMTQTIKISISSLQITIQPVNQLEKVSMGHGCPRLLFLFHLQLNIGYTISEQDTQFKARLFL